MRINLIFAVIFCSTINSVLKAQINDVCWREVAVGAFHTLAIYHDGSLWAWGNNSFGQFGDGTTTGSLTPKRIGNDTDWKKISTHHHHSAGIKSDGTLWTWGTNVYGELGYGNNTNRFIPTKVEGFWQEVSVGGDFTVAIRDDGSLWSWGRNNFGQLGLGHTIDMNKPNKIGSSDTWYGIEAGYNHCLATRISTGGLLFAYGWGDNQFGQLGITSNIKFMRTPFLIESVYKLGISAGFAHSLCYFDAFDQGLVSSGFNGKGQLGIGSASGSIFEFQRVKNIDPIDRCLTEKYCMRSRNERPAYDSEFSAGDDYSIAIVKDRLSPQTVKVVAWGSNQFGQLGIGNNENKTTPAELQKFWTTKIHGVRSNSLHSAAVGDIIIRPTQGDILYKLWMWGHNLYGQLGDGTTTHRNRPTLVKCPSTSSTNEDLLPSDVTISPNPFLDHLSVKNNTHHEFEITIIDVLGNHVLSDKINSSSDKKINNLENFTPGIYFIQLKERSGKIMTHKIIKI